MNIKAFWELIEQSRQNTDGNTEGQVWELESLLMKKEADDAISFVKHLQKILADSFTAPLWEVSYLINLDDREDTFEFFRAWMILQGKKTFDLIQENPDAIIDYIDKRDINKEFKLQRPELLSIGFSAWEELTGNPPEEMPLDRLEIEMDNEPNLEDEHLEEEYPLLWEVFA